MTENSGSIVLGTGYTSVGLERGRASVDEVYRFFQTALCATGWVEVSPWRWSVTPITELFSHAIPLLGVCRLSYHLQLLQDQLALDSEKRDENHVAMATSGLVEDGCDFFVVVQQVSECFAPKFIGYVKAIKACTHLVSCLNYQFYDNSLIRHLRGEDQDISWEKWDQLVDAYCETYGGDVKVVRQEVLSALVAKEAVKHAEILGECLLCLLTLVSSCYYGDATWRSLYFGSKTLSMVNFQRLVQTFVCVSYVAEWHFSRVASKRGLLIKMTF